MFKTIILCALYNLSDDQVEHQIRDRLSFMRFLGLGLEGRVPDAKTVWLYREQLTQAGVIEALFEDKPLTAAKRMSRWTKKPRQVLAYGYKNQRGPSDKLVCGAIM